LRLLALLATGRLGLLVRGLRGEELRVDVGEDTTLRDDDVTKEPVELLVVADGELKVTGDDAGLLVVAVGVERGQLRAEKKGERGESVPSGVTGKLEDLGSEVFEDSGEVD
jgi:hypothetical protein